jgi:hypothetical protein
MYFKLALGFSFNLDDSTSPLAQNSMMVIKNPTKTK